MKKKRKPGRFKLDIVTGDLSEWSGPIFLQPPPGGTSIPLVPPELRDLREGEQGFTEDGKPYFVVSQRDRRGRKKRGLVMIIFPKDWSFGSLSDKSPDKPI